QRGSCSPRFRPDGIGWASKYLRQSAPTYPCNAYGADGSQDLLSGPHHWVVPFKVGDSGVMTSQNGHPLCFFRQSTHRSTRLLKFFWRVPMVLRSDHKSPGGAMTPIPAAEYLRMSTEHQQYSQENQSAAIRRYAADHDMVIVHTYQDCKTGLVLNRREGLRQLLHDVVQGEVNYKIILVFDVSRWGRFRTWTRPRIMSFCAGRLVFQSITAPSRSRTTTACRT